MRIDKQTYQRMPSDIKALFLKEPNPQQEEVMDLFPQSSATGNRRDPTKTYRIGRESHLSFQKDHSGSEYTDSGSAARFFYCAKCSKKDRNEGLGDLKNIHATVKPTDLMRYLCRLITPPGGLVLDPFAGSGSTGKAAVLEGFGFVGIDIDKESVTIAKKRIKHAKEKLLREETITL